MFHLFSKLLTFKNYYLRTMKSIVLLGAGNVATHLCKAIHNLSDFKIIQVYNHSEKSLIYLFPDISKEWHPTKNDLLLPEYFSPGSGRKVWWLGKCEHEWQDSINHRTSGRDCPQCRYKKASQTRRRKRMSPGQLTFNFI